MADMTPTSDEASEVEDARVQKIAERFVEGFDLIEDSIPSEATVTRDILQTFLVYIDENWDADLPNDEFTKLVVTSIFKLERKIARIERHLGLDTI